MSKTSIIFYSSVTTLICLIVLKRPDVATLCRWALQVLLAGAVTSFIIHLLDKLRRHITFKTQRHKYEEVFGDARVAELTEKANLSHDRKQEEHSEKARSYYERIQKPREERKRQEEEDKFQRFSGPAWKGKGARLGGDQEHDGSSKVVKRRPESGGSREAAGARKLPPEVENPPMRHQEPEKPKVKLVHKLEMPPEPVAGEGVITVAFRTPVRPHRRRFHVTDNVQLLLDYMTTLGYHHKIYTLYAYPHVHIAENPQLTLRELDLVRDCTLNVEEKNSD